MNQRVSDTNHSQPDSREADVIQYLLETPYFFSRHPELLGQIEIPHQSGEAVSLIERQVQVLRNQVKAYRENIDELVEVARDNETLHERMHRLTLALIDAATFDEVLNALEDELYDDFKADAVELRLFSTTQLKDQLARDLPDHSATFEEFFSKNKPLCGPLTREQTRFIFGVEGELIQSTALIPLKCDGVLGLLAIGSNDPERFAAHQGTEFLTRLGELISRTLQVVSLPGI